MHGDRAWGGGGEMKMRGCVFGPIVVVCCVLAGPAAGFGVLPAPTAPLATSRALPLPAGRCIGGPRGVGLRAAAAGGGEEGRKEKAASMPPPPTFDPSSLVPPGLGGSLGGGAAQELEMEGQGGGKGFFEGYDESELAFLWDVHRTNFGERGEEEEEEGQEAAGGGGGGGLHDLIVGIVEEEDRKKKT